MLGSLALAALVQGGLRSAEAVGIGAFLMYTCYALSKPALSSTFPHLVPKAEIGQASALNALSFTLGQLVGPLLAAACVGLGVPALGFALNGLSYLGVILVMWRLDLPSLPRAGVRGSIVADLGAAGRYIRGDRRVAAMLIVVAVSVPILDVVRMFAPVLTVDVGDADEGAAALVAAALGAGAATGQVLASRLLGSYAPSRILPPALVGMGVCAIGIALAASSDGLLLTSLGLGAMYGLVFATSTAAIQATVPDHLRGRVMSVHTLVHLGLRPVTLPIAGAIAAAASVAAAVSAFVMLLPIGIAAAVVAGHVAEDAEVTTSEVSQSPG
jgi:MFS family permease